MDQSCRITDDWKYKEMRVIWMENAQIKVGILADRGSDIFEFRYKPLDLNFLLRLPGKLRNLQADFTQMRNTSNQFEDHYYGGWQEILPNSPPFNYRGASLGQHGEVSMIPWKYAILEDTPDRVSVKLWNSPVRVPIRIEKTLSVKAGDPTLYISERLSNLSRTTLDIMWGHHIAFGLPLLENGARVETNARHMFAEPTMPDHRLFKPGITTEWPNARDTSDQMIDASRIPSHNAHPYSELAFLWGYDDDAFYTIRGEGKQAAFSVHWDASLFKYLWYWQERYATQDFPWWGSCYTVALEPWTSQWKANAEQAIADDEWLKLEPGKPIETSLRAGVVLS